MDFISCSKGRGNRIYLRNKVIHERSVLFDWPVRESGEEL